MAKPKVCVSFSYPDTTFATKLVSDLTASGVDAWMYTDDSRAGLYQAPTGRDLADCDWFLLVLTPSAIESLRVQNAVRTAFYLANEGRIKDVIFIKATDI